MKKIRYLPFGYQMVDGEMEIVPEEQELLEKIFAGYQQGKSLQKLSDMANQSGMAFRENAPKWNKNMIARILDDTRYWTGKEFPAILSMERANEMIRLRKGKTTHRSVIWFFQKKVACCHCGEMLRRNSKNYPRIYWDCPGCGMRLGDLSDEEFLYEVEGKLNWISQHPEQIEEKEFCPPSLSIQTARMTNEINQLLDQRQVDAERVVALILDCASEKYRQCCVVQFDHVTRKIKAMFQRHGESGIPIPELLEQTTQKVLLQPDGSTRLQLQNGKIL